MSAMMGGDIGSMTPAVMALCFLWVLGVAVALIALIVLLIRGAVGASRLPSQQ